MALADKIGRIASGVLCVFGIKQGDVLVSYDVSSLFTSIPLDETIELLADKAFCNNWFNLSYDLEISKNNLV